MPFSGCAAVGSVCLAQTLSFVSEVEATPEALGLPGARPSLSSCWSQELGFWLSCTSCHWRLEAYVKSGWW